MTQQTSPFLEGKFGWALGESNWNLGMDENLLKFSYLFDRNVDAIVSSLPAAVNGEAYFNTTDNRIYYVVGGSFYSTPVPQWFIFTIRSSGDAYQFNGTSPVLLSSFTDLANNSNTSKGSALVGYKGRTVYSRLSDTLSVRDYITTTVDGTTSNQSGIVAAVAAAFSAGATLYWSAGTYVSDANIPNFHDIRHLGDGVVKRGSETFKINQSGTQLNKLYISTAGSSSNDGLSTSFPLDKFQTAFDVASSHGTPVLSGLWEIVADAGTYDFSSGQQTFSTPSKNRVVIRGPAIGHPSVPTCVIDGGGVGVSYRHGLSISGNGVIAEIRDIKAQNFTESPGANTRIGIVAENQADVFTRNCHTTACSWTGLYAAMAARFRVSGGIIDGASFVGASGIITNDTESTIGYLAASTADAPVVKNCTSSGIYWSRGSQGHVDYTIVQDCGVGIEMEQFSSAALPGCDLRRNTIGLRTRPGALYRQDGVPVVFNQGTADANTTPFDACVMSGNGDELRSAQSYARLAYDRVTRTASGVTSGSFPTIYTLAADRLNGVGKSCRVHTKGVYTVTASSSLTLVIGGLSLVLAVAGAGTNVSFELDVELMEVTGGYRAIGKLSQGLSLFRMGTSTAGFDKTVANPISIGYSLTGAGDTLNIYRTDVYVMG